MSEQKYEVLKMSLWDALDYLAEHNLVADGRVVWMAGKPHLVVKPESDELILDEVEAAAAALGMDDESDEAAPDA